VNGRMRAITAVIATVLLLGGAAAYCITAIVSSFANESDAAALPAAVTAGEKAQVVFRNTAAGTGYGLVASVPVGLPDGEREVTGVPCDRVAAAEEMLLCLRIDRGILTTFSANLIDADGTTVDTWPLPGIPSRARIAADGGQFGFTSFVTGEAYATIGFSTATQIIDSEGTEHGNLESFSLLIDGEQRSNIDRNFWGVTFTDDHNVFYATAATGGQTWLVRGDLAARTLTSVRRTAECPSVSPDGTRIAYKKNVSDTSTAYWSIAVLDLTRGDELVLPDTRNIDDQVEWLDDSTLLYSVPRTDEVGDSDVWSIAADGSAASEIFIEHASSPTVVRR
jgi:FlaG/FlaF family flagellin (archaellin)